MITRDKKYNNLPKDVINSLTKMTTIIKITEENLFLPKDDILREINIEIGSLQRAMDIFNQYCPDKRVNLSIYIIQRKKAEAVKSIEADGSFGSKTKAAVIAYQKSRGLSADGYVGYDTHTSIIND